MNCDIRELCFLVQTLRLLRELENSLISLGGQKENVSNKVNSPPIRDFMNERYQDIKFKPFKISLSKSTVQAQSRIIKTESIPVSTRAEI